MNALIGVVCISLIAMAFVFGIKIGDSVMEKLRYDSNRQSALVDTLNAEIHRLKIENWNLKHHGRKK